MRLAIAAASLTVFLSVATGPIGPAAAAEGDLWAVDRQNVNVRSGPSTNTDVLMTINPGDRMIEIAAKGEWFFVDFPDHGRRGWVFGPLLVEPSAAASVAPAAPAPVPNPAPEAPAAETQELVAAATPSTSVETTATARIEPQPAPEAATPSAALPVDDEPAAVRSFRDTVSELNDRAVSVAGINLFSDVRSTGGGGVQVLATETWASVPEAGQSSYMNALFDRWASVANGLGPLSLQIVDPTGQVMMERSGS